MEIVWKSKLNLVLWNGKTSRTNFRIETQWEKKLGDKPIYLGFAMSNLSKSHIIWRYYDI